MPETNKIILFEYDKPIDLDRMLNYESGIWFWTIAPGTVIVEDDNGNTGYYDWTNDVTYNVQSFRYEEIYFSKTTSLPDCKIVDNSFFYDTTTTRLYVHREDEEPILSNNMIIGVAVGYSYKSNTDNYYNDSHYEPRVKSLFALKKSIDPLFYGLLKYQSGNVRLLNNDGHFDDWRSRNLYAMASRLLVANYGEDYSSFERVYSGYIENDKRGYEEFSVVLQDPRKALTQGVATNLLNTTEYPLMNTDNTDISKPIVYGSVLNVLSYCTNELESPTPTNYTFLFADTTYNSVSSIEEIRVNGVVKTAVSTDLSAGTFVLSATDVSGEFDQVKLDFTVSVKNGVNIIKDLMTNYDNRPYLDSFYDTTEIDLAEIDCRDTSLYIDQSSIKLKDAIQSVANDCDIRFFIKDSGLYTIRLYDVDRTPITTILKDDWIGTPNIVNNGSEYLTSVRIGYKHNIDDNKRLYYENTDYKASTFQIYKQYKTDTIDTELMTLADAIDKSDTIMNISSEVSDIIERTVNWDYKYIEPTDFIIANPVDRNDSVINNYAIYEVMSVNKSLIDFTIKLSLRYIQDYTEEAINVYAFVRENDDYFNNENGDTLIITTRNDYMTDESDIYFVDENNNNFIEETEVE